MGYCNTDSGSNSSDPGVNGKKRGTQDADDQSGGSEEQQAVSRPGPQDTDPDGN